MRSNDGTLFPIVILLRTAHKYTLPRFKAAEFAHIFIFNIKFYYKGIGFVRKLDIHPLFITFSCGCGFNLEYFAPHDKGRQSLAHAGHGYGYASNLLPVNHLKTVGYGRNFLTLRYRFFFGRKFRRRRIVKFLRRVTVGIVCGYKIVKPYLTVRVQNSGKFKCYIARKPAFDGVYILFFKPCRRYGIIAAVSQIYRDFVTVKFIICILKKTVVRKIGKS